MIHKCLEFCTWIITRFTKCRKITIVYHVKKSKDQLEMVSGRHVMTPGTILRWGSLSVTWCGWSSVQTECYKFFQLCSSGVRWKVCMSLEKISSIIITLLYIFIQKLHWKKHRNTTLGRRGVHLKKVHAQVHASHYTGKWFGPEYDCLLRLLATHFSYHQWYCQTPTSHSHVMNYATPWVFVQAQNCCFPMTI